MGATIRAPGAPFVTNPASSGGSGTVTGTGTTNIMTKWANGPGGVLGDSLTGDDGSVVQTVKAGITYLFIDTNGPVASLGPGHAITGADAYAGGERNTIDGNDSSAWGEQNDVAGNDSTAHGNQNNVSGDSSSAHGRENDVSGGDCSAHGDGNDVSGNTCSAHGADNTLSGQDSTAHGEELDDGSFNDVHMYGENFTADRNDAVLLGISKIQLEVGVGPDRVLVRTGTTLEVDDAASGTFTTTDLKTVTVVKGIITSIV